MSSAERNERFKKSHVRAVLQRQHGLITSAQWCAAGSSPPALTRCVQAGEFERVLPRVYRSTLFVPSLHQRALAAVLWGGDGAVVSHTTAVQMYGTEVADSAVHIWVPSDRSPKSSLIVVHRGGVAKNDRRIREGVSVTSPARTLVDVAGMLDEETLEAVMEDFLHRGVTTPLAVGRVLNALGGIGRPGSHLLRAILADRDDASLARRLEVKLWRLMRKAGLKPVRQYEVRIGGSKYRLDFAFVALKVAVEGQGFAAHGGRLAHDRDARRLADLVGASWRVVPVTWEMVTREPDVVIDRIRSALVAASAAA